MVSNCPSVSVEEIEDEDGEEEDEEVEKEEKVLFLSLSFPIIHFLIIILFLCNKEDETIGENPIGKKDVEEATVVSSDNEVLSRQMTRLVLRKVYFKSSLLLSILYLIGLLPLLLYEVEGTKRLTRSSDSDLPLEKGVDFGSRRVRSKPSHPEGRAAGETGVETDSPSSRESKDDDDFCGFKVAMG